MANREHKPKRLQRNANFFTCAHETNNGVDGRRTLIEKRINQARGSGILNLADTGIDILTTEMLRVLHKGDDSDQKCEDDFKWWMVSELKEIRLSNNKLKNIEKGSLAGMSIKVLLVDNNCLESVPTAVWDLKEHLKKLVCSNNQIRTIQVSDELQRLVVVDFSHNELRGLPSNLATAMQQLTILDVRHNQIEAFPKDLPKRLKTIHAAHNRLVHFSDVAFAGLVNLETLDIGTFTAFSAMQKLLFVRAFSLSESSIANLIILTAHNKIEALPTDLSDLCSLKFLDVRYNNLSSIDFSTFPERNAVDQLLLGFNRINDINVVVKCSSLTVLDVRDNKLSKLPQGVLNTNNLKVGPNSSYMR